MLEEDANARKIVIPQRAPQSIEVPPNVEAKHIVSLFSPLLSYSSNPLVIKVRFLTLVFFRLLAGQLQILFA